MKSIGAEFLRPDALPGINRMCGMQYQIVPNIALCPELNNTVVHICDHNTSTLIYSYALHIICIQGICKMRDLTASAHLY